MNKKGIVLSGLIYVLLTFFILLLISFLAVLWYRQNALDALRKDADSIYDDIYIGEFSKEFNYTGDVQTFVVPKDGNYKIELWGAQGGGLGGGKGGYTLGNLYLDSEQVLYVYVGQNTSVNNATAFNGGTGTSSGYPGGGATDVRLTSGNWNDTTSLRSRIMVASGGGAASGGTGGYGGTLVGGNGPIATGGTQTSGGTQQSSFGNGGFGYGGGGCGGGGGYYGGGGALCANGAGGGSSFISGYSGCNAINSSGTHTGQPNHYSNYIFNNTQMIDGNTSMPSPTGTVEVGHTGNGYAKITYLP